MKDNLDDIAISDNYRAIAIGSLILNRFDWLILILNSGKLTTDELQFGFQKLASTTMCRWGVNSVVDYYNRAGRALDGVMRSQIPSMHKMESGKEQFLPLCFSVFTLTKLSSYYDVQQLDAKYRVSIWASVYMQMILSCFLLAEQVCRKW